MTDPIVADYLDRLYRCAAVLPVDRRIELVDEIAGHIAESLANGSGASEADVRNLLERLGDPAEIVAAAGEDLPLQVGVDSDYELRQSTPTAEVWSVTLLTVGSLVPVLGWLAGIAVAWTSTRWRTREKVLLTLLVPGGPGLALWLALFASTSESCSGGSITSGGRTTELPTVCTHNGPDVNPAVGIPVLLFVLVAPVVVAVLMYRVAARRAAAEPPQMIRRQHLTSRWGAQEIIAVLLLAVGGFVAPFAGPLIGLVLACTSNAWTRTEKMVAAGLAGGGLLISSGLVLTLTVI